MKRRFFLVLTISLLLISTTFAMRSSDAPLRGPRRDPGQQKNVYMHNAGNISALVSNWGELGNPDQFPSKYGFEFPKGSGNDFLFSAGIWIGAIVDDEMLVSTTTDGDNGTNEFSPSIDNFTYMSTGQTSTLPFNVSLIAVDDDEDWNIETDDLDEDGRPSSDWDGPDADANNDGIFSYDPEPHVDEDPPGNIAADFIDNDHDGFIDADDDDFDGDADPDTDDDDGDGLFDEDGAAIADQQLIAIYDDTDPDEVQSGDHDGHTPLHIRVIQNSSSIAFAGDAVADAIIIEYTVTNIGDDDLEAIHLAFFADTDIGAAGERGDEISVDDWVYFEPEQQIALAGDDPEDDDEEGPGVFGMIFLQKPFPAEEYDFSYRVFERVSGGDPDMNEDKYEMIAADPEDNAEGSNRLGDWRFLLGLGPSADEDPWQLTAGESMSFTIAMIGAETEESLYSTVDDLRNFWTDGRYDIYTGDYAPQPSPPVITDVGDGESLTITIGNYVDLAAVDAVSISMGPDIRDWEFADPRTLLVSGLIEGDPYYFVLKLLDENEEQLAISDTTWGTPQSIPGMPSCFWVMAGEYYAIKLGFQPNPIIPQDFAGYNIYRAFERGEYSRINEEPIPLTETTWTDHVDEFGTYDYRITSVDTDGNESRAFAGDPPAQGWPFTLTNDQLLVIDETRAGNGNPGAPTDAQVDEFYAAILQGVDPKVLDYDDFREHDDAPLTARYISEYKTILWHNDDRADHHLQDNLDLLSAFCAAGGDLILSGWDLLDWISDHDSAIVETGSFYQEYMGLNSARRVDLREFTVAIGQNEYPNLYVDQDKIPENWEGLDKCWVFDVDSAKVIATFQSRLDESEFNDLPCAIRNKTESGSVVTLGYPLYFAQEREARDFILTLLHRLDVPEVRTTDELIPTEFAITSAYPNPFNSNLTIEYALPEAALMELSIYDVSGRLVSRLTSGVQAAGNRTISWQAEGYPAGMYICRLKAGDSEVNQKILLLK